MMNFGRVWTLEGTLDIEEGTMGSGLGQGKRDGDPEFPNGTQA